MNELRSIQETFWPDGICFGCGPANDKGLHIRSFPEGGRVIAKWRPEAHHQAFPNILNGGIIGTLLDCHSMATAWWALSEEGSEMGATMVTAEYSIKLRRPTPLDGELTLIGEPLRIEERRVVVAGRIEAGGEITATSEATLVKPRSPLL